MGITKLNNYKPHQLRISSLSKALAHPARVAILESIAKQNSCICGELVDEIGLSQSTISQHLKELKQSKLIIGNIEGPKMCYCINKSVINEMMQLLTFFFQRTLPSDIPC